MEQASGVEPRVRSINFTAQEKRVLTSLISKHPSINTKYCDNGSLSAKHISWHEVYDRFCAHFPIQPLRDIKQLKGCWKRLKMKRKLYPYEPNKWFGTDDNSTESTPTIAPIVKTETERNLSVGVNDLNTSFTSSGSSCGNNAQDVGIHHDVKPFDVANIETHDVDINNVAVPNGHRLNDVAVALQELVSSRNQQAENTDEVNDANLNYSPLASRRKMHTPRRLPVRPVTSYLRPPVSTIPEMSDVHATGGVDEAFLKMSKREHRAKMRILQLKEWKLKHECLNLKIGLPPKYTAESDDDDDDL